MIEDNLHSKCISYVWKLRNDNCLSNIELSNALVLKGSNPFSKSLKMFFNEYVFGW